MSQPPYGNQPPYGSQPPYGNQPSPGGSGAGWGQPNPGSPPGQPPTGGIPSYNQPAQQFNQPPPGGGVYGAPPGGPPPYGGGYGAPPPSRKSPLPWIIGGLVLLLVAGGVILFLVLNNDDDPTTVATTSESTTTETTEESSEPPQETEMTPRDTEDPGSGSEPNFAGSEDAALDFVNNVIDGNYDAAFASLCADGADASDGDGFTDAQALGDDFWGLLGSNTVLGGGISDVVAEEEGRDTVTFEINTDIDTVTLEVQVIEEGSLVICGYDLA